MSDSDSKNDNDMEEENNDQDEEVEMPEEIDDLAQEKEEILQKSQKTLFIEQNEKDKSVGNFIFIDEDHTLGNSLRYLLAQRKDVDFVGYSIPHPLENKMNLRIQTYENKNSKDMLMSGLQSICNISDVISKKFQQALVEFEQSDQNQGIKFQTETAQKQTKLSQQQQQIQQQQMISEQEEDQQQQEADTQQQLKKKKAGKKKK